MNVLIDCQQGSPAWHAARAQHFCASEAAAAMGVSKYVTRTQLLNQKATGIAEEVSAAKQRLFDAGHEAESKARSIAERIAGVELFPVVGTLEVDGLKLLASFDGIDMLDETTWESKLLNADLVRQVQANDLEPHYWYQLEHQLLVSGASRTLFTTSDGTVEGTYHCWYESQPERRAALIAGWKQFERDLAEFVPATKAAPVIAAPVETLPAVSVKVDGALAIVSNLPDFGAALRAFIAKIPEQPSTDQEFADTDAACKALKKAEDALEAAESNALAQLTDVDTMRRLVADFKALARTTRLQREKLVAARKEAIKGEIVAAGVAAFAAHIRELNAAMPANYMPQVPADFGGCIKGLKSVDSIRNAVDSELARAKIAANEIATRIQANAKALQESGLVVHDAAALVLKAPDDLAAVIAQRKAAEQARQEAERERIRAEEAARLEREAAAKAAAEKAAAAAAELASAKASEGAELSPAAQALHEAEGAARFDRVHKSLAPIVTSSDSAGEPLPVRAAIAAPASAPVSAVADDGARLTLGQINERIAPVSISVAGLSQLGFEPAEQIKASRLYRECDFPAICRALSAHVLKAVDLMREAA